MRIEALGWVPVSPEGPKGTSFCLGEVLSKQMPEQ